MVLSTITPDIESELFDLSEELDLLPQFQHLLDEERDVLPDTSPRAPVVEERMQESDDIPLLKPPPSPAVAAAICLMVEDPYFETPMSSLSLEEAPMDSTKDAKQWTVSSVLSTPSLCLNGQTLELNSPASGK